jgi:hypothetical protein
MAENTTRAQRRATRLRTKPCPQGCGAEIETLGNNFCEAAMHDHMRDVHRTFVYKLGGRRHHIPIKAKSPILIAQKRNVDTSGLLLRIIEAMARRGSVA